MNKYIAVLAISALDYVSGIAACIIHGKKLESKIMWVGLVKKSTNLLLLATMHLIDYNMWEYTNGTLMSAVYAYILVMETMSITENIGNKDIVSILKGVFKK